MFYYHYFRDAFISYFGKSSHQPQFHPRGSDWWKICSNHAAVTPPPVVRFLTCPSRLSFCISTNTNEFSMFHEMTHGEVVIGIPFVLGHLEDV